MMGFARCARRDGVLGPDEVEQLVRAIRQQHGLPIMDRVVDIEAAALAGAPRAQLHYSQWLGVVRQCDRDSCAHGTLNGKRRPQLQDAIWVWCGFSKSFH